MNKILRRGIYEEDINFVGMLLFVTCTAQAAVPEDSAAFHDKYQLQKMLVLSRHNIRSPLGETINKLTPHKWVKWTSAPGELSQKGGELETIMGQYFRERLVYDGLIAETSSPQRGKYVSMPIRCSVRLLLPGIFPVECCLWPMSVLSISLHQVRWILFLRQRLRL